MAKKQYKNNIIPDWFNLKCYDELNGLTLKELFNLLSSRYEMFKFSGLSKQGISFLTIPPELMVEKIDKNGLLRWSIGSEDLFSSKLTDSAPATTNRSVNPIRVSMLCFYAAVLSSKSLVNFRYDQHIGNIHFPLLLENESENHSLSLAAGGCPVDIDLKNFSDDEIIAEIMTMLPIWRKEIGVQEPKLAKNRRIGGSTIKNIIDYAVLPIIDLTIWAALSNSVYSSEQLTRLLYPEPDTNGAFVSSKHFIETRQPFALSFVHDDAALKRLKIWITSYIEDLGATIVEPSVAEFL